MSGSYADFLRRTQALAEKVYDIIEATYAHDDAGNRIEDQAGSVSGADVIEALCRLEVDAASVMADVASRLRNLGINPHQEQQPENR